MNKNIIIVLAGGFVIALLVAIIVQASFGKKDKMVEIAVAAMPLKLGAELTPQNVKWKPVPSEAVFSGAIQRVGNKPINEQVKGRLGRDLAMNEPVLTTALVASGRGNVLAATMKEGMRATAIKVSAESMVGGFINPGDRVDVILTFQVDRGANDGSEYDVENPVERHATETVLENVRVLAVDQTSRKDDDRAKVGRTVTLEVDQRGAEKLALATEMGDLSLALRALGDTETKLSDKRRMTTDVEVSSVLQEINRNKRRAGGSSNIVRIYSGDTVENITVRR